jgi:hypothetical protein
LFLFGVFQWFIQVVLLSIIGNSKDYIVNKKYICFIWAWCSVNIHSILNVEVCLHVKSSEKVPQIANLSVEPCTYCSHMTYNELKSWTNDSQNNTRDNEKRPKVIFQYSEDRLLHYMQNRVHNLSNIKLIV